MSIWTLVNVLLAGLSLGGCAAVSIIGRRYVVPETRAESSLAVLTWFLFFWFFVFAIIALATSR